MRKMLAILFLVLIVAVCTALPASAACNPNPSLMQDECYSSCANWAKFLYGSCNEPCYERACEETPAGTMCNFDSSFYACVQSCDTECSRSLNECEDYCHEW